MAETLLNLLKDGNVKIQKRNIDQFNGRHHLNIVYKY